eukprot:1028232-Rhodomonas_salina.1
MIDIGLAQPFVFLLQRVAAANIFESNQSLSLSEMSDSQNCKSTQERGMGVEQRMSWSQLRAHQLGTCDKACEGWEECPIVVSHKNLDS